MGIQARYVHTNLIAADWRALADFYIAVFGCAVVPPERDYTGAALDAGTGLDDAHLQGVHLRLPGWATTDLHWKFTTTMCWQNAALKPSMRLASDTSRLRWMMSLPHAKSC